MRCRLFGLFAIVYGKSPSKRRSNFAVALPTCARDVSLNATFVLEEPLMKRSKQKYRGFSLLELLAVVTILGIIAVVVIPRISVSSSTAKSNSNQQNRAEINSAVERWYFEKGTWPANDLSDIGADTNFFPNGLPTNPTDNSAYTLNATTHRAN
jgi:prepilin-type N-terminal cleavage/methylation domain-containing protein